MRTRPWKAIRAAMLVALMTATAAAGQPESERTKFAVGGTIGLSGIGVETTVDLSDSWNLRAGIDGIAGSLEEIKLDDVKYDTDFQGVSGSVFADLYPWKKSFRLSFGAIVSGGRADLEVSAENDELKIGDNVYPADQVLFLGGRTTGSGIAPYFGVGWGNPVGRRKRWTITCDLGLTYRPSTHLILLGELDPSADEDMEARFREDLRLERERLEDDLNDWRWFPVARVGFSWRF